MSEIPILVCTAGSLQGRRFVVPEGGLSVGRADDNQIRVTDEGVSRYHVRLLYNSENGKLWLEDAGSRNGVFVNENRISGHKELKVGDDVTVAQHTFAVRWQDESVSPAGTRAEAPESTADGDDSASRSAAPKRWFWPFS